LIFVTVGSMFPFDRLIRSMDHLVEEGLVPDAIEAQIGDGQYEPKCMPFLRFMSKPEYEDKVRQADLLIAHAGAGTIALALQYGKPLLVLPRLGRLSEHVNDHQIDTARKFAELNHVLLATDESQLAGQLNALRSFSPRPRLVKSVQLAARIDQFLRLKI
jgi:beta-1,4-N-acetylglucosaminyltransferase